MEQTKRNSNKRMRTLAGIVILLAAGIGIGVWVYQTQFAQTSGEEVYVTPVSTLMGNLENGMRNRFQGIVESNNSWTAQLDAERPVKEYKVNVGDTVETGTVLLEYDNTEKEEAIASAKMDLQRLQDDLAGLNGDVTELNAERSEATDELVAEELLIEIQQKQLDIRTKGNEIASKQQEITNLESTLTDTTVTSAISGVVKSLGTEEDGSGLTIVDVNTFQVKARVNEQNLSNLYEGEKVIVFSRVSNDIHWKGKITKIDTENTIASSDDYDEDDDEMTSSSNYPFYISLKKTNGLAVGQHVYVEENVGQLKKNAEELIELDSYMIADLETETPYVWAAGANGRLEKRPVVLGEYNEDADRYRIEEGLAMTDLLAQPEEDLEPGMKTVNTQTQDEDEDEDTEDDEDGDEDEELED